MQWAYALHCECFGILSSANYLTANMIVKKIKNFINMSNIINIYEFY
jgi:hypothetical protein